MSNYQLLPPLTEEEYKALKADIAKRGILVPIEVDEIGVILDGHHRLKAWQELRDAGVELPDDYPRVVRGGMTEAQKRNHVRALNIVRRQLTKAQRKEQMAEMRKDGATYQEIADATGVSEATARRATSSNDEVQPASIIGKDGKERPAKYKKRKKKPAPPQAPPVSIYTGSETGEEKAKAKVQKIVNDGSEGATQEVYATIFSSESEEYYTPPLYVDAVRDVMGAIDLDPASCPAAQEWIKAKKFYTVSDDGLMQKWAGKVWLNPPYGKTGNRSNQEIWANHLAEQYVAGSVTEAILLVKAAMGYNWFEGLWYDWPVCFVRERISFIKSDGSNDGQSKQGTAFLYFGSNEEKFKTVFGQFGRVILPSEGYTTCEGNGEV